MGSKVGKFVSSVGEKVKLGETVGIEKLGSNVFDGISEGEKVGCPLDVG